MYYWYLGGQDNANQPPNREESLPTKNYKVNSDLVIETDKHSEDKSVTFLQAIEE